MNGASPAKIGANPTRIELVRGSPRNDWNSSRLISAIGRQCFMDELTRSLVGICEPDYIHVFEFKRKTPKVIFSASRDGSNSAEFMSEVYNKHGYLNDDPSFLSDSTATYASPTLKILDIEHPHSRRMEQFYSRMGIGERAIVWGAIPDGVLGLSMIRSQKTGALASDRSATVAHLTDVIFPMVTRHVELAERSDSLEEMHSLAEVEATLAAMKARLTTRERQVLTRTICGLTARQIAEDLGIGEETVVCYRRRSYQKIGVFNTRDLLFWYFGGFIRRAYD